MLSSANTLPAPFRFDDLPSERPIEGAFWTFDAVEDRLIEAMRFAWRDTPGRWPFASDGPWHLMRAAAGDYDARGGDLDTPSLRIPLTRAERARMDEAVGWLALIPPPVRPKARTAGGGCDARLVVLATRKLAAHRASRDGKPKGQVRWSQLLRPMGMKKGGGALGRRYERAVAAIVAELVRRGVAVDLARG